MKQNSREMDLVDNHAFSFRYLEYLPAGYEDRPAWPMILYLHGAGERGEDLGLVKSNGIPRQLEGGMELPFIVISPQCPDNTNWIFKLAELSLFLDSLPGRYRIDLKRIYLTGLSMGGYGTWFFAMYRPKTFAAIAPICGGGMAWSADVLKDTPVWAFHGDADDTVSVTQSREMIERLRRCGGDVKFTVYPGVGHDSWTQTYSNPELYGWFLSKSLA